MVKGLRQAGGEAGAASEPQVARDGAGGFAAPVSGLGGRLAHRRWRSRLRDLGQNVDVSDRIDDDEVEGRSPKWRLEPADRAAHGVLDPGPTDAKGGDKATERRDDAREVADNGGRDQPADCEQQNDADRDPKRAGRRMSNCIPSSPKTKAADFQAFLNTKGPRYEGPWLVAGARFVSRYHPVRIIEPVRLAI